MALSKRKDLRQIELVFVGDEINPICHCIYDVIILEDGVELLRKKERENMSISSARTLIANADVFVPVGL